MAQDPLADLRTAIDAVDDELLELLNRRAELVGQVGERKQAAGLEVYAPNRERAIIERLSRDNPGPFPSRAIRPVFQEVISACLSLEAGVRVAYLGPEATFTHQAARHQFGASARAVPCGSIAAVFSEVERGEAEFGVVPVENSSEGVVSHTLDSFLDSPLTIAAEIALEIDQCLLARPGLAEGEIARVYSHPQGLAQCRGWLAANLSRATQVEASSTAEAARLAHGDAHGAAIASELAGRLYGLEVLRQKLQDLSDNLTRFLVIAPPGPRERPVGPCKTSVVIALPDAPGALYGVLRPLSEAGLNLSKIESRPSRRRAWDYVFFLDLDGHAGEPAVAAGLEALARQCPLFKVLGSYRKADPR